MDMNKLYCDWLISTIDTEGYEKQADKLRAAKKKRRMEAARDALNYTLGAAATATFMALIIAIVNLIEAGSF